MGITDEHLHCDQIDRLHRVTSQSLIIVTDNTCGDSVFALHGHKFGHNFIEIHFIMKEIMRNWGGWLGNRS